MAEEALGFYRNLEHEGLVFRKPRELRLHLGRFCCLRQPAVSSCSHLDWVLVGKSLSAQCEVCQTCLFKSFHGLERSGSVPLGDRGAPQAGSCSASFEE